MRNRYTTTKNKFGDIAFKVLKEEDGPLPCNILREKVSDREGVTKYVSSVTARQIGSILKRDKRFQRIESSTKMRVQLWTVKK